MYNREQQKQYEQANVAKIARRKALYYQKNKEHILKRSQDYYRKNTKKVLERTKNYKNLRIKTDVTYKLAGQLRTRLYKALKSKKWLKNNTFAQYIGCSLNELKLFIENRFQSGMNWNNHGKWHIDHIIPLASAETIEQLYKLCHYTNLQPLWAEENQRKQDKIIGG